MSCNGCRVLRKGCSDSCLLRPCLAAVEGADAQGHATLFLAKFFGRAGLMGFISNVSESQRPALFQSLLYEACGRTINPVYGSAGLLWSGSWHLCEAAVDAVLRGVNLQPVPPALVSVQAPATPPPPSAPASSPPPEVAYHVPPPQPSQPSEPRQQTPDIKPRQGHANNAAAMPSFPFHMMDPAAMAYWPLAMAPMMGAHMAAMGSAGYPPAYPTGAPQYATQDTNTAGKPQPQQHTQQQQVQIQQIQIQQQQQGNQMWMPQDGSKGQGGQQSPGHGAQHMYEHHNPQSGICSPSGGTNSEACSPMHLATAPLVAPVARRLTPQSGPFMPSVNTGNGHGVLVVGSEGELSPIQQLERP